MKHTVIWCRLSVIFELIQTHQLRETKRMIYDPNHIDYSLSISIYSMVQIQVVKHLIQGVELFRSNTIKLSHTFIDIYISTRFKSI